MTQLYPSRLGCNKCGSQISWDVATRERLGTKLPLNLDGTIHTREVCANNKAVDPQSLFAIPEREPQSQGVAMQQQQSATRTEAIEKAHLENMESSERLRQSVNSLTEILKEIRDVMRSYMENLK